MRKQKQLNWEAHITNIMGLMYDAQIVNVVASAKLNKDINLVELDMGERTVEYRPEKFPGAVMKLKNPKASFLVFRNGEIVCTGLKSKKEIWAAVDRMAKIVLEYAEEPGGQG